MSRDPEFLGFHLTFEKRDVSIVFLRFVSSTVQSGGRGPPVSHGHGSKLIGSGSELAVPIQNRRFRFVVKYESELAGFGPVPIQI